MSYLKTGKGSVIKNYGAGKLVVVLQGFTVDENFWVCDSDANCILGMSFMEAANVVLDIGRQT